jgi:hypothetical protein
MGKITSMATLTFATLICAYKKLQSALLSQVRKLASRMSSVQPGAFILIQFQMSNVTQVGESISNLVAQLSSIIMKSISNQRVQ